MLKNKEAFRQGHRNFAQANKHTQTAKPSDVEAALFMWFKDARAQKKIPGSFLQEKAKEYATRLGIGDIHFSSNRKYAYITPVSTIVYLRFMLIFNYRSNEVYT